MAETILEAKHLSKLYKLYDKPSDRVKESLSLRKKSYHKDYYALKDINFSIQKGETIGVVGKNGSGKSTLLKILTEVLTPTEGELSINGKVAALLELGAGFNGEYTGLKNIYLNGSIMGISHSEMEKRVEDIVKFADIGDYIYQPVKLYSSGMFVRLAFSVATHVEPDILIIDEALAVGDVRFQLKCMDKFLEFKEKGVTIIYVSHDINSIKRFCDRTLWINEGKLEADGLTDEVTDMYLDYLKTLDAPEVSETQENEEYSSTAEIAEVVKLTLVNENGEEVSKIRHGQKARVVIDYFVNDNTIKEPVLGVAILRVDNLYICGVNTLLDHVKIPWKKGMNRVVLNYDKMNLVGGSYYFDVALYDQTATVPFDYRTKYKDFFVDMPYIAEGISILDHKWQAK